MAMVQVVSQKFLSVSSGDQENAFCCLLLMSKLSVSLKKIEEKILLNLFAIWKVLHCFLKKKAHLVQRCEHFNDVW